MFDYRFYMEVIVPCDNGRYKCVGMYLKMKARHSSFVIVTEIHNLIPVDVCDL